MQRYKIVHRTYYNFSAPVTLGLHELLLRPREDHAQRIQSFDLRISPEATLLWHRDVEGNSMAIASFEPFPTQQLAVESEVIVQQYNEDPLDFIVADYAVHYPFAYCDDDRALLAPYAAAGSPGGHSKVKTWIGTFWRATESIQTYSLLLRMTQHIHATFKYQMREQPGVQSAEQTLTRGTGSCRDFAYLFMQAATCLGLAARFVSGYLYVPQLTQSGSTHAWAEVYLPGAGWLGFDPTTGAIVGADHFPVAVARLPESVPPIAGAFSGAAQSTLEVGVWVSCC
ncbi:MAG: transglutaminase family protein [Haliea sp.]|nr:transglutaminase family protein [Haliea sp.]